MSNPVIDDFVSLGLIKASPATDLGKGELHRLLQLPLDARVSGGRVVRELRALREVSKQGLTADQEKLLRMLSYVRKEGVEVGITESIKFKDQGDDIFTTIVNVTLSGRSEPKPIAFRLDGRGGDGYRVDIKTSGSLPWEAIDGSRPVKSKKAAIQLVKKRYALIQKSKSLDVREDRDEYFMGALEQLEEGILKDILFGVVKRIANPKGLKKFLGKIKGFLFPTKTEELQEYLCRAGLLGRGALMTEAVEAKARSLFESGLVQKLADDPNVDDPEALAAWIGRNQGKIGKGKKRKKGAKPKKKLTAASHFKGAAEKHNMAIVAAAVTIFKPSARKKFAKEETGISDADYDAGVEGLIKAGKAKRGKGGTVRFKKKELRNSTAELAKKLGGLSSSLDRLKKESRQESGRPLVEASTLKNYNGSGGEDAPVFAMKFRNGDMIYFKPISVLKNGNWKGLQVPDYADERNPRKAVNKSATKGDFVQYFAVKDVPPKVAKRFAAKLR